MWQKITQSKFRGAWAALMMIAVLAISLSFAQVRAVANTFLGLFRVEKIEAVSIGIDLADLPAELEPSFTALDAILGEDMFIESIGEPYQLENSGEAHSLVNFPTSTYFFMPNCVPYDSFSHFRIHPTQVLFQGMIQYDEAQKHAGIDPTAMDDRSPLEILSAMEED